jgi:hypothetical protein
MDSPGHSAKYCVYVLMEQFLNVIVDLVVIWHMNKYGSFWFEEAVGGNCWKANTE